RRGGHREPGGPQGLRQREARPRAGELRGEAARAALGRADPRRRERARDRRDAAAAQRARGADPRRVPEARRAPARARRSAPGRRAGTQAARRLGRQARQRHRDGPGRASLPGPHARRPADHEDLRHAPHHAELPRLHRLPADPHRRAGLGRQEGPHGHGAGEDERVELGGDEGRPGLQPEPDRVARSRGPQGPAQRRGRGGGQAARPGDHAAPGTGREEGSRGGAARRLRHAHVRQQPAARRGAAQRRPLPERHRLARRPGGAGCDPQPHRARLACRADPAPGRAGLLPLRAHRPAAHDRDRHRRVVAPEVPVIRRILILLVLVAALGIYLYVYELPEAAREGKKAKLLGVDKDAVTGLVLAYPDRELELRKDDKGWRLVRPAEAPADDTVVGGVLSTLADAEVQKTLDQMPAHLAALALDTPPVPAKPPGTARHAPAPRRVGAHPGPGERPDALGTHGLAAPRRAVTLPTGTDGAASQALLVGGETTQGTQKQIYAKRGDQPTVYAMGDSTFRTLAKPPSQFRD